MVHRFRIHDAITGVRERQRATQKTASEPKTEPRDSEQPNKTASEPTTERSQAKTTSDPKDSERTKDREEPRDSEQPTYQIHIFMTINILEPSPPCRLDKEWCTSLRKTIMRFTKRL